jgi:hypothetical protein
LIVPPMDAATGDGSPSVVLASLIPPDGRIRLLKPTCPVTSDSFALI